MQKVILMHREAVSCMNRGDDDDDEDWVADVSNSVGNRVELGTILFSIAQPDRIRRKG